MKFAVIVPTYNAGDAFKEWIKALLATDIDVRDVYIIDSGSSDNTSQLSREAGFNVEQIDQTTFNHGGTRQKAISRLSEYELVVYLTQDAVLQDVNSFYEITRPFKDQVIGAVCGRQLPRKNAGPIETHARLYNYHKESTINSINHL